jgi:hypothetical protein
VQPGESKPKRACSEEEEVPEAWLWCRRRQSSREARLQELWQDVGGARRPAPTKVHLRATAAVDKQLEKAETLLRFALLWFA